MKNVLLIVTFLVSSFLLQAQSLKSFVIYNSKGRKVSVKKMFKKSLASEMVFFGELHDNPISHWLQLELTKSMYQKYKDHLVLGFEMFEQDQQDLMNQLISGEIEFEKFEKNMRLWSNYKTDYRPILEFAKEKKIRVLADNIPRRYASVLFKKGLDSLYRISEKEKEWIVPLNEFKVDTSLSQYQEVAKMAAHMGMENRGADLVNAQAIKDATMAYFILKNLKEEDVLLHFNGAFHTDYFQGIIWYIQQKEPEKKITTISTVYSDNMKFKKEDKGKADFIIYVPESMTRTY